MLTQSRLPTLHRFSVYLILGTRFVKFSESLKFSWAQGLPFWWSSWSSVKLFIRFNCLALLLWWLYLELRPCHSADQAEENATKKRNRTSRILPKYSTTSTQYWNLIGTTPEATTTQWRNVALEIIGILSLCTCNLINLLILSFSLEWARRIRRESENQNLL